MKRRASRALSMPASFLGGAGPPWGGRYWRTIPKQQSLSRGQQEGVGVSPWSSRLKSFPPATYLCSLPRGGSSSSISGLRKQRSQLDSGQLEGSVGAVPWHRLAGGLRQPGVTPALSRQRRLQAGVTPLCTLEDVFLLRSQSSTWRGL